MMTEQELATVVESIEGNRCGIALDLSNKQINAAQAQKLFKALSKNTTLQSLGLGCNNIGNALAKSIADALQVRREQAAARHRKDFEENLSQITALGT